MKEQPEKYRVNSKKKFKLNDFETSYQGATSKKEGVELLESLKEQLAAHQVKLFAGKRQSLLVIFQAMDAAGKDSAIKHVLSGVNPQGCAVKSFKTPSSEEYQHDFLWRHNKALPEKGIIGVHNRSHYENVLVCKVHPEYVLNEALPGINDVKDIGDKFWEERYESIRNFETHLAANGTTILKFFLYLSTDEQKERFQKRIETPEKQWKFLSADLDERKLWKKYMSAYEEAIAKTSTEQAPWYIIPADNKWFTRVMVAKVIDDTLKKMNLSFPVLDKEGKQELKTALETLNNDGV